MIGDPSLHSGLGCVARLGLGCVCRERKTNSEQKEKTNFVNEKSLRFTAHYNEEISSAKNLLERVRASVVNFGRLTGDPSLHSGLGRSTGERKTILSGKRKQTSLMKELRSTAHPNEGIRRAKNLLERVRASVINFEQLNRRSFAALRIGLCSLRSELGWIAALRIGETDGAMKNKFY
jgi:hypothetical protein